MEKKEQLKAVIELFMEILSAKDVKSDNEVKSLPLEKVTPPSKPNQGTAFGLSDIMNGSFFNPISGNLNQKIDSDTYQEKLTKAAAKSVELIDKIEEIDKEKAFHRYAHREKEKLNNIKMRLANQFDNKDIYNALYEEKLNEEVMKQYEEWKKEPARTERPEESEQPPVTIEVDLGTNELANSIVTTVKKVVKPSKLVKQSKLPNASKKKVNKIKSKK